MTGYADALIEALDRAGTDWSDSARDARRGNIAMPCPFCGPADTGRHMSVRVEAPPGVWACWRDRSHSGPPRAIGRLLRALGVPGWHSEASRLAAMLPAGPPPLRGRSGRARPLSPLWAAPLDLREADDDWGPRMSAAAAWLRRRWSWMGDEAAMQDAADRYGLLLMRELPGRVVIPIEEGGEMVNYQARAIEDAPGRPRYLAADTSGGLGRPLGDTVFNLDGLHGGPLLVIVEGAFDAISIESLHEGVHAAALLGTACGEARTGILRLAASRYRRTLVMLDEGAEAQAMTAASAIGCGWMRLPEGDDPEGRRFDELEAIAHA